MVAGESSPITQGTPVRRPSPWTPEKLAELRKYVEDGRSASEIARALGPAFTRNSVVAKCHRLGIELKGGSRRAVSPYRPRVIKRKKAPASQPTPKQLAKPFNPENAPEGALPFVDEDNPMVRHFPAPGRCKWPFAAGKTSVECWCNQPAMEGSPYCEMHTQIASTPEWMRKARQQQAEKIAKAANG